MSWDPVPYFTQFTGAEHSPEVFRAALYASTNGKEGIVGPTDLKVVALDVPGTAVRIAVGNALVLNRALGGDQQTYAARMNSADQINVPATGASARSSLVIVSIEDPGMTGETWDDPADPAVGPYVFTRIVPNVPAGTTDVHAVPGYENRTAITLARIDLPANTGTVLPSHITDLRKLANPRTERQIVRGTIDATGVTLISNGWRNWPIKPITGIAVPSWATHAVVRMDTTMRYVSGDAYAQLQGFLGAAGVMDDSTLYGDQIIDATTGGGQYRQPAIVPSNGWFAVPANVRGKTAQASFRARGKTSGAVIASGTEDYYFVDVTFTERPQ